MNRLSSPPAAGFAAFVLMLLAGTEFVLAHPGHGPVELQHTAIHYITELQHLIPLVVAVVLVLSVRWLRKRDRQSAER